MFTLIGTSIICYQSGQSWHSLRLWRQGIMY
jgi:hypothetical protein